MPSKETFFRDNPFFVQTLVFENCITHTHDFFELAYIQQGKAINVVNGKEKLACKGDFFILDTHATHDIKKVGEDDLVITNCLFLPELIDPSLKDITKLEPLLNNYLIKINSRYFHEPPELLLFHDADYSVSECIRRLAVEFALQKFGCNEIARSLLIQILIIAMRTYFDATVDMSLNLPDSISQELIKLMSEKPGNSNILHEYAEKKSFSNSYISKKFKEETGHTFISHLQKFRIEKSCRLLLNSDMSIAEIANNVGYNDLTFYHKLFKNIMNCSPLQFRLRNKPFNQA